MTEKIFTIKGTKYTESELKKISSEVDAEMDKAYNESLEKWDGDCDADFLDILADAWSDDEVDPCADDDDIEALIEMARNDDEYSFFSSLDIY